jgi:hypothetical protein
VFIDLDHRRPLLALGEGDLPDADAIDDVCAFVPELESRLVRGVDELQRQHRIAQIAPQPADVEARAFVAQVAEASDRVRLRVREHLVEPRLAVGHRLAIHRQHVADRQPLAFLRQPEKQHLRPHRPLGG